MGTYLIMAGIDPRKIAMQMREASDATATLYFQVLGPKVQKGTATPEEKKLYEDLRRVNKEWNDLKLRVLNYKI